MIQAIRMTHKEFIELCATCGLRVESISNRDVRVEDNRQPSIKFKYSGRILPNCHSEDVIYNSFFTNAEGNEPVTLQDAINNDKRIFAIKIVLLTYRNERGRGEFEPSLKEVKELVDANWEVWRSLPECDKIDQTPTEDLPLLIGSLNFEYSRKHLERKLRGET